MNEIILMGRLTRDPEVRYGADENKAAARFTLAVNRRFKREGEQEADFFDCVCFGRLAEFCEQYLRKATKIVAVGELRNNNYTNKDGQKVYHMQIIVNKIEFAESKKQTEGPASGTPDGGSYDYGFMAIPDEELPFK